VRGHETEGSVERPRRGKGVRAPTTKRGVLHAAWHRACSVKTWSACSNEMLRTLIPMTATLWENLRKWSSAVQRRARETVATTRNTRNVTVLRRELWRRRGEQPSRQTDTS